MSETVLSTDPQLPGAEPPKANGGTPPSSEAAKPQMATAVREIQIGRVDGRNKRIDDVFFKRKNYAIYASDGRIVICYSDDETEEQKQIAAVAPLIPQRDELIYLMAELSESQSYFRDQIASALWLALAGQAEIAKTTFDKAIAAAKDELQRSARVGYLSQAASVAGSMVLLLFCIYYFVPATHDAFIRRLLMATGAGGVGALLSVAIAIRQKSVAFTDIKTSLLDGALRVLIGVICGSVLYLLLASQLIGDVKVSGIDLSSGKISGPIALLIGFAAGFLERLVPELFEKTPAPVTAAPPPAPIVVPVPAVKLADVNGDPQKIVVQ